MMGEGAMSGPGSPILCNLTAVTSNAPVAMETKLGQEEGQVLAISQSRAVGSRETCRDMLGTFSPLSEFSLSSNSWETLWRI